MAKTVKGNINKDYLEEAMKIIDSLGDMASPELKKHMEGVKKHLNGMLGSIEEHSCEKDMETSTLVIIGKGKSPMVVQAEGSLCGIMTKLTAAVSGLFNELELDEEDVDKFVEIIKEKMQEGE